MLSVLLVSVAAAGVAIFVGIKPAQPSAGGDSDFVPAGKVRHIVIERRLEGDASKVSDVLRPVTGTIEAWYSNGPKSMLQHVFYNDYDAQTGKTKRSEVWVEEGTMYTQVLEKKVVLWQAWPYDPVYAPNPNLARDLLQQPNSRVISDTVIDGRNTLVISWPDSSGENQWWIDKDTNRAYRWQVILAQDTTPGSGDFSTISIEEIVVDEVVGADTLPPDFFRFKLPEGFRLVEREMPPPHSSPGTVTP
jgi:hypothetical protein